MRPSAGPLALGLALVLAALGGGPVRAMLDESGSIEAAWSTVRGSGTRGQLPQALARSRTGGSLAVGDEAGVTWWRGERRERAALSLVRDLAFDERETLWIATQGGLYSWTLSGRPQRRSLRGGESANRIHRVVVWGAAMLLATDAGAVWSSDGRIFQSLSTRGAIGAATRVAIRPPHFDTAPEAGSILPAARRAQAWVYGEGRLSVVRGLVLEEGLRVTDTRLVDLPRPSDERLLMDLAIDPNGERLYMVFEDLVAWRSLESNEFASSASPWQIERPVLPPGARIRRLGWAAGRVWLATDHGLLEASSLGAPFRRAASPPGTSDCMDLQSRGFAGAVALCRQGLFVLAPAVEPGGDAPAPMIDSSRPAPIPPDPPVAEIRRRALERAGLAVHRSDSLWAGLKRRAFWPEVSLRFGVDSDQSRSRDSDQSFVSGATRSLFDRSRDDDRSYEASIELDWELGGIVYPDASVDLSRELRQVVSLRDDVVDEIHQLYFERQSIREQLAEETSLEPTEAVRLRNRARELEAGLDAWTGGWLSRWRLAHTREEDGPRTAISRGESPHPEFEEGPEHPDNGRERKW